MRNPFSFNKVSPEENRVIEKELRDIEHRTQEAVETAQACLDTETFQKYVAVYQRTERHLIDAGIYTKITEPNQYNALCRTIFSELKVLRKLLDNVRGDAQ